MATRDDPFLLVLHCACRFDHLGNKVASPAHREREIVSAGVASAAYDDAATSRPADSNEQTPREKGLRVLAGSGENTLSPPANLTHQVTRKVRARAITAPESAERRVSQ